MKTDSSKTRNLAPVWWAIVALLLVEIGARFVAGLDLRAILAIETVSFLAVAAVLFGVFRKEEISNRRRQTLKALAFAFALGAVRSGLWVGGIAVYWANLTILAIAVLVLAIWVLRRRRPRRTSSD